MKMKFDGTDANHRWISQPLVPAFKGLDFLTHACAPHPRSVSAAPTDLGKQNRFEASRPFHNLIVEQLAASGLWDEVVF